MKREFDSPEQYIEHLPESRKKAINKLRKVISTNLPQGFTEMMNYGMIGYVVPKTIYPDGYHANPELPLPFINIASQKHHIALYHLGLYADKDLMNWFLEEFKKYNNKKPDIGKSCIRFKNDEQIPFDLIAQLAKKMKPQDWINLYQKKLKG